jgi:hypothetical protein
VVRPRLQGAKAGEARDNVMPLVLSEKSGSVQYVAYKETLVEILEHTNFDGEDWAVGDRVIWEDGTEARIVRQSGSLSYTWDEPRPANLNEVKGAVDLPEVHSWDELFSSFR